MRKVLLAVLVAAASLSAACVGDDPVTDEVEVEADDDGKADAASELRVRTGDTTLWLDRTLGWRGDPAGGAALVLRGRTSRNLTGGLAFIMDDIYGDYLGRSARTFEVSWPVDTARGLVDGVNQFVRLSFAPSQGRPDDLTARVTVRPRLAGFAGSAAIYLTAEVTPVVATGAVVYRVRGRAPAATTGVRATLGGQDQTTRLLPDGRFEVDLEPRAALAALAAAPEAATPLLLVASRPGLAPLQKQATLTAALKRLGLTAADAYDTWPAPTCSSTTQACLRGLPADALDTGSCGEALVVSACAGQIGVRVDEPALSAALASARAQTATATFRAELRALIGPERAEALQYGAEQQAEANLEPMIGRWFLSPAARDLALTGAGQRGLDAAILRPLDYVEPTTPVAGDPAAARAVAADAVLAALAGFDFTPTEYRRSYAELALAFRARHIADIAALRQTGALGPHPGDAALELVQGRWLDVYVEVAIERATGAARPAFLEVD
ncbi:MAG: hypothetical protein KA297_27250 [Kofleriaceae bacterium]|nr:hypothetical protein [Kofleriaceae bacterium]